ncbi:branched-chain alpha-keto acid dehydrogenase E1-alpha subunit [Sparassis crispa]|uniref:2-oxoisovalerate dehydrogenase subunit alpha n=1 Tax=Sparassis crispa TaxID=139825 RepID=A0A401H5G8_9APHY|nr:branched-chain alpha-keto acid dehydrogenase E1-alpha subunit [Sparassis crispa]GBE89687.1 branched-chain alpha-keto acid dehydrogenase E1-alpha subunit [Sparassis crispa]
MDESKDGERRDAGAPYPRSPIMLLRVPRPPVLLPSRPIFLRSPRRLVSSLVATAYDNHTTLHPESHSAVTSVLRFFNSVTEDGAQIPMYRVLDGEGKVFEDAEIPEVDETLARKMYENMVQLPIIDNLLYNVQRQGKISFYMTSYGEEAALIGSAAALEPDDEVLGQYRELGVLLYRGFTYDSIMNQVFGTHLDDSNQGKQMPVHFGSRKFHFHTISSPLATQIPQAAGVGYALKRDPIRGGRNCAVVYFGDGAASEGDFHAGMMLASTVPSPTLFFARNNGFAISTPSSEQYHGDGIASRGPGYGVHTLRVDGNDVLAVYAAVKEARRLCLRDGRAVLIEAMTYRVGHHSTSDDSFAYRPRHEVEERKRLDNPISRFRLFLEARGWWDAEEEKALLERLKDDVLKAFRRAEAEPKPELQKMFEEVYGGEEPWTITENRAELKRLLQKYGKVWEPWRSALKDFKGAGKALLEEGPTAK